MRLAAILCIALLAADAAAMQRSTLGTSAAVDPDGRLWIAYAQAAGAAAHVIVQRSDDTGSSWQAPVRVNAAGEPVAAEGENRPKIAFGLGGEMYVTWTSPTSAQFTGDIRFARSLDGGKTWSTPSVVHRDRQLITHRFESLLVDAKGRVWVTWIDKRDVKAAVYYAYSDDRGTSWQGDFKLADSSCECCRIALASDAQGRVGAMWRAIFAPNERDHAFAFLDEKPRPARATFDRWRIDACPHHGPSLAVAADGTRHAVWFNQVDGQGRAFYGRLTEQGPSGIQTLPAGATHADVAVAGRNVALAWKRFDGTVTKAESWLSNDGGQSFSPGPVLQTAGESDQPRLVSSGPDILLVWRNSEGVSVRRMATISAFGRDTLAAIERKHAGQAFWLVLWDLECSYCMKSLANMAAVQRAQPQLKVVTIATDPLAAADQLAARLAKLGLASDAYAFADAPREALQFAIDPGWLGEKPRAYRYGADGKRTAISGVIERSEVF
jgi:hypothetical protein